MYYGGMALVVLGILLFGAVGSCSAPSAAARKSRKCPPSCARCCEKQTGSPSGGRWSEPARVLVAVNGAAAARDSGRDARHDGRRTSRHGHHGCRHDPDEIGARCLGIGTRPRSAAAERSSPTVSRMGGGVVQDALSEVGAVEPLLGKSGRVQPQVKVRAAHPHHFVTPLFHYAGAPITTPVLPAVLRAVHRHARAHHEVLECDSDEAPTAHRTRRLPCSGLGGGLRSDNSRFVRVLPGTRRGASSREHIVRQRLPVAIFTARRSRRLAAPFAAGTARSEAVKEVSRQAGKYGEFESMVDFTSFTPIDFEWDEKRSASGPKSRACSLFMSLGRIPESDPVKQGRESGPQDHERRTLGQVAVHWLPFGG